MTHQQYARRDAGWEIHCPGVSADREEVTRQRFCTLLARPEQGPVDLQRIDPAGELCHLPSQAQIAGADIEHYVIRSDQIQNSLVGGLVVGSKHGFPRGGRQVGGHF